MKKGTDHQSKLLALKRIEGQIRGVRRMIEEGRYCIDIINAMEAVLGALKSVEAKVLRGHMDACVRTAFLGKSHKDKDQKIEEICELLERIKK